MTKKQTVEALVRQMRYWEARPQYVTYIFEGGVSACLEVQQGGTLFLSKLFTPKASRYQGYGAKAMRKICRWADMEGLTIELDACPHDNNKMSDDQLMAWYAKFGFKMRRYRDMLNLCTMYRTPRKT